MTVEDNASIDAVGVSMDTGAVMLSIIDPLPWDRHHLELLQEKLNTYLGFIESGEIYTAYPDAKGRELCISLVTKFRPDDEAEAFILRARSVVEMYGATLNHQPAGAGYSDDHA